MLWCSGQYCCDQKTLQTITNMCPNKGGMALKMDLVKAYDRLICGS